MAEIRIRKSTATVYKIQIDKPLYSWAHITIDEWKEGGSINIQSDYGDFCYSWGAIGDRTLREFLCGLDYGYFMGKAAPGRMNDFDINKTIRQLKDDLLTYRKDVMISKEDARKCWIDIQSIDEWSTDDVNEYRSQLDLHPSIGKYMYGDEWESIPFCEIDNPQCVAFWERIWPVACAEWKKEIEQEDK